MSKHDASSSNALISFVQDWLGSRDRELLLKGLPAAVCILGLGAILTLTVLRSPQELAATYQIEGREAQLDGELEDASLYYKKALSTMPDSQEMLAEAAAVADSLGDSNQRDALLGRLKREFDDPAAHLMSAEILLRTNSLEGSTLAKAEEYLEQALTSAKPVAPASWQESVAKLRRSLAILNRASGQLEKARTHLEAITAPTTSDLLELAAVSRQAGDPTHSTTLTDQILAELQEEKTFSSSLHQARAYALREQDAESIRILEQARRVVTSKEELMAWAEASVWCFRELWEKNRLDPPLIILDRLLSSAPLGQGLARLLIDLSAIAEDTETLSLAALETALSSGKALVAAHVLIGLRGLNSQEDATLSEADSLHFKIAANLSASSMLALSRCALAMIEKEPSLSSKALTLSETAVNLGGHHPYALEIHSHLLGASGRWEDVVALLTPQASKHPPQLRGLLATAHEKLGNEDLAERYRKADQTLD